MLELLVAIGILVTLAAILVPVVSTVRDRARGADTQAFLTQLEGAINRYHTDFRAYPGPFSDDQLTGAVAIPVLTFPSPAPTGFALTAFTTGNAVNSTARITGSENLVLGLLGGLRPGNVYNPAEVGQGPASLNPGRPGRSSAYVDAVNLSWNGPASALTGLFRDEAGTANDTIIPEFVDRFASPLPVLYLRSRLGVQANPSSPNETDNAIITDTGTSSAYNLRNIIGYTGSTIGVGKTAVGTPPSTLHGLRTIQTTSNFVPANANAAYPYFRNPSNNAARNKDRFILVSAGRDRIYGTGDDITNFGRF